MDYGVVLTIIGVLTVVVGLVTEVLKQFTSRFMPNEFLATIVSEILTLIAYFGYTDYAKLPCTWYTVAAAVVVGFLVSYSAQFGYDKLCDAIDKIFINKLITRTGDDKNE